MISNILDGLLTHIAIIDRQGTVVETNSSWDSYMDRNIQIERSPAGSNYFQVLQQAIEMGNDYALKLLLGIKKVLREESTEFELAYPLKNENLSKWFKFTIRPIDQERQEFIMTHEDITSSVQAEKDEEDAKNRYKIQFMQSLDGILITDTKGNILDANPAASDIVGWTRDEFRNITRDKLIDTQDAGYIRALRQRERTGSYKLETNMKHRSGEPIPVEITSHAFRTKTGKLRAVVNFRDISHRKQMESDLLKTKHFTESALNSVPGVFLVLDAEGNIVRWNEHMVTSLGYSPEELADKNALDFIVEEEKEKVQESMEACMKEGSLSIETKVTSKDGSIKDYYLFGKRFVEDGKPYLVGTGLDVTDKNKMEKENQRSQLMLQQLFDNAPVGIAIADTENKIVDINKSFENIFGYNKSEAISNDINKLIAPDEKTEEAQKVSSLTAQGRSLQIETKRCTKTGKEIPVLIGSIPVKHDDEIIAIYGMYVDVSQQVEYQQRIEKTLEEKDALLAELHHRVKNNLALITSMLELQVFESDSVEFQEELTDVKTRIMTIASIHEVLYQNGSLSKIPFSGFIKALIESKTLKHKLNGHKVSISQACEELFLNIKQSIPAGLLLNELLALILSYKNRIKNTEISIVCKQYGPNMHLILEGENLLGDVSKARQEQTLHHTLIETLASQLYGTLLWPNPNSDYQKFELIFKMKEHGTSPAADLLEVAE